MADVSVKMGVSGISQFRSEITQAQASVKTYDSALKLAEKQFRATGNAEQFMQDKTTALQGKLAAQQSAVKSAEAALKSMTESGVNPASQAYQKMQQSLLNAQAAVLDTQNDINNLGTESADAAGKTDQLANSLGGLNKKVSLEQVISGVNKITEGMEKAAAKAVELGKAIWENITDSARWGDDTATQAMILNMDVETYQRYKKVFDTVGELTVQEWQKAKMKVQKAINDPTKDQTDILNLLGINTHEIMQGKYGVVQGAARDFEDVFWEIGETLRRKVESREMTQDLADTYANALFGRSFANLNPMFALGKEGFAAALEEQNVVTEESVNKLAGLNDQLIKLEGDFRDLKSEVLADLAPALEGAAKVLDSLLGRLLEYLKTDEGKQALEDMGKAVEGLFSDLGEIDPEEVVEGFAGIFNGIIDGLKWLDQNKGTVIGAMEAIITGWAGLKLTGGILTIANLINGISGLTGAGAAAGAAEAGAATGAAWGRGFAAAVMKAAPWLVGLYTLLNPASTAGNDLDVLFNEQTGQLTTAGWDDFNMAMEQIRLYGKDSNGWFDTLNQVGDIFGDIGSILTNNNAINTIAKYRMSGDLDTLIREMEAMGYIRKPTDEELRGPQTEVARVDADGGMYDADGNRIGYNLQGGGQTVYKDRRTGKTVDNPNFITTDQIEAVQEFWDFFRNGSADASDAEWDAAWEKYEGAFKGAEKLFERIDGAMDGFKDGLDAEDSIWPEDLPEDFFKTFVNPELAEGSEAELQGALDGMNLQAVVELNPRLGLFGGFTFTPHANGIHWVPFDGYPALLHKGERVAPAREVSGSRTFSSNLYVESMYMNNGQDADGLAAKVAAENQRIMNGYGS